VSAQKQMLLVPDGPRIQWVMQHGYLHIIWPEQIEEWEIEFVEELLPMALKQMRKAAAKRAADALADAERIGKPTRPLTKNEQSKQPS
jgi:hypothetical protein